MSETLTFRPSAAGTYAQHMITGHNDYTDVNDVVADGFSSYIGGGAGKSTYLCSLPGAVRGKVVSVRVYCCVCSQYANGTSYPILYNGSSVVRGTGLAFGGGWAFGGHNYAWTTNPWTGVDWTVDDLTDLEIGWESTGLSGEKDCTQIYAEVTFIPISGGGAQIIGLGAL